MKTPAFRAVALILLIFSLIAWSGAATIAAAWMPAATDGCCEHSGKSEEGPVSCSPEECPCFSCSPFTPGDPLAYCHLTLPGFTLLANPLVVPLPEVVRAIDYPPESC